jgi:purine nucleoside phosphorylase
MTNTAHTSLAARIARSIALPMVSVGIIGGAALGMAGMANAATYSHPANPGFSAPSVKAHPAPNAQPGARWHTGVHHLATLHVGTR